MKPAFRQGFTLIELLMVIAIFGLLAAGAMPMFQSMSVSRSVEGGLYDLQGLLEYARSEAVAKQSYVWVGFENTTTEGRDELVMSAAMLPDGSAQGADMKGISRLIRIRNVEMIPWTQLTPEIRNRFPGEPVSVQGNSRGRSITVGSQTLSQSLTFTPQGSVMLAGTPNSNTPYDLWIDLSLRETRGGAPINGREVAILVNGANGVLQVFRVE